MTKHVIKIEENFANAIVNLEKSFVICKNYINYQKCDHIKFVALTRSSSGMWVYEDKNHEICSKEYEITYVITGHGLKDGYVFISIMEV